MQTPLHPHQIHSNMQSREVISTSGFLFFLIWLILKIQKKKKDAKDGV